MEGVYESQMGKTKEAIKSIKKNIRLNKKNANAYFLLGNARLMQKEHTLALSAFKTSANINPKLWQSINNEALVYFELGERKKAINRKLPTTKYHFKYINPHIRTANVEIILNSLIIDRIRDSS